MPLEKITRVEGSVVHVLGNDIDTDRIIPARFMRCVTFEGLGQYAFYDVRFDEKGKSKNHPLDNPKHKGATVLLSGRNFGCGSSREHAPQALQKFGIRAIVAESFAEIFAGNCTTLGIPCVQLPATGIERIAAAVNSDPKTRICVDIEAQAVRWGKDAVPFKMKEGARDAFLRGEWDALGQLLDAKAEVAALAAKLDYFNN
jgi:3-isopropylmalate/(R)-2-methylmalate dehydratase small subunit